MDSFLTLTRPHLELRQSENPVHRHSDVVKFLLFFREQFPESLVSTKPTEQSFRERRNVRRKTQVQLWVPITYSRISCFVRNVSSWKWTGRTVRWLQWLMTWLRGLWSQRNTAWAVLVLPLCCVTQCSLTQVQSGLVASARLLPVVYLLVNTRRNNSRQL